MKINVLLASLTLLTTQADRLAAQEVGCTSKLDAEISSGQQLLDCLIELQTELRQLERSLEPTPPGPVFGRLDAEELLSASIKPLEAELKAANAEIKALNDQLAPFKNAVGAVVAFDGFDGCPKGWSIYTPATGRTIVGAGEEHHPKHREWLMTLPTGGEKRVNLEPLEPMSSGGEQQHVLTTSELPRHDHFVMARGEGKITPGNVPSEVIAQWGKHSSDANYHYSFRMFSDRVANWGRSSAVGGDPEHPQSEAKAHNNMPPYLALYYCKKD